MIWLRRSVSSISRPFYERLLFSELHLQISDLCIEGRFQLARPVGRDLKSIFFFLKLAVQCSNFRFNPLANLFCLRCGEHLGLLASELRLGYLFPKSRYFRPLLLEF